MTHEQDAIPPHDRGETPTERGSAWRIFLIPALLAAAGYFALYALDAHLRHRNGPWDIQFRVEPDGTPAVSISQKSLELTNVIIRFPGERLSPAPQHLPSTLRAATPEATLSAPFGRIAFHDLTYLPGTVVLQCFGHEVQMLPKGLFLNRQAFAWESGALHALLPENKLPSLDPPAPPRRPLMIPAMGPPRRQPDTQAPPPE